MSKGRAEKCLLANGKHLYLIPFLFPFGLQNEYSLNKLMSYSGWNKSQIEQK